MRVPLEITGLLAGRCKHSNVFSQAGLMDDGLCVFSCEPASDWLGSDNNIHTPAHLGWPTSHVVWFAYASSVSMGRFALAIDLQ